MLNIEDIAEFLGDKIISERLLPYILSIPNLKDRVLTWATLKALRILSHHVVGTDELKYIVTSCDNLFFDPNEYIVLESIKTICYIAKQHQHVFENNDLLIQMTSKLIMFWMHPALQIRDQSVKWIVELIKPKHISFIYCNVLPIINSFLSSPSILKIKQESELKKYLKINVSRFCFDLATSKFNFTTNEPCNLSFQDRHVLCLIQEMINSIPKHQPNRAALDFRNIPMKTSGFWPKKISWSENFKDDLNDLSWYVEDYYYSMIPKRIDIKKNETNYGLNERQRHPQINTQKFYNQEVYYSVKGLEVVDENMRQNVSQSTIVKRQTDIMGNDENDALCYWQPKGRLVDTIYSAQYNNFPDPISTIITSSNSKVLISGSKNGSLHYFNINDEGNELEVEWSGSMFITDQDKPKQINSISIINQDHIFCVGMDEGTIDIYAPYSSEENSIGLLHRISRPDEGQVCNTCDFRTDFNSENVFAYSTQKGYVHIHDIRVKIDVTTHEIGMKYGMPSALITSTIQTTNKLLIGTLGGFIHLFDVRYNIPMVVYEHSQNHPILDLWMYYPNKRFKYKMFWDNKEFDREHCLIATGGVIAPHNIKSDHEQPQSLHEVSMLDIYLGEMKATFTVDDTMNEATESIEVPEFYAHDPIELSK